MLTYLSREVDASFGPPSPFIQGKLPCAATAEVRARMKEGVPEREGIPYFQKLRSKGIPNFQKPKEEGSLPIAQLVFFSCIRNSIDDCITVAIL